MITASMIAAAGCAGQPAPPAAAPVEAAPEAKAPEANTWGPQSPQPKWWEAGATACPQGATLSGALPPKGNVIQCILPNGTPHGLSSVWFENGHEGTMTEYKNGVRHGKWLYWLHNHTLAEGQFEDGRRVGTWRFWFDEGAGFDMKSRYEMSAYNGQTYVMEQYNKGLLLKVERYRDGKPVPGQPDNPVEAVASLPGDPRATP